MNFLKLFLAKTTARIKALLLKELESFQLWIPVALALGALMFFKYENPYQFGICGFIVSIFIYFFNRKSDYLKAILILTLSIGIGYGAACIRVKMVATPKLETSLTKVSIKGVIEELGQTSNGSRILLREIESSEPLEIKNIRISTRFNIHDFRVGDRIKTLVNLMPPPKSTVAGSFDYSEYAYFKQIGAIGYTVGFLKKVDSVEISDFNLQVNKLRDNIASRIKASMSKRSASIAEGMLIGNIGAIDKADYEAIRIAGLAHIISISGMHIVVVVGLIFFTIRFLLSHISYLAINYNLKKIAATGALIASFGYLLITGSPVSAQRAFIMSAIVLLGIIIDRQSNALRAIVIAATVIIICTPETLKSAGLQMSMAASIALIITFDKFSKLSGAINTTKPIYKKVAFYVMSVTFSTLIAGLATAPFVIFHFNQFSTYSIIANIAAIPLSDFFIMPLGIISIILMPLGLEHVTLAILEPGIVFLIEYSKFIASLPNANFYVPSFSSGGLVMIAFGGIIFALCKTELKFIGVGLIFLGFLSAFNQHTPDIIVDGSGKVFGVVKEGAIYLSNRNKSRFAVRSWMDKFGFKDRYLLKDLKDSECNKSKCIFKKNNKIITILSDYEIDFESVNSHIFVNLTGQKNYYHCKATVIIDSESLKNHGTHSFIITEDAIEIKTAY